jgi:hypothetical protein
MQLRPKSKLLLAAALGLAFTAVAAQAQLLVNVSQRATFSNFVGGINNNVTNNGSTNINQVVTSGTAGNPFTITYDPQTGPSLVQLNTGTLITTSLNFSSPIAPANFFTSAIVTIETDFDSNGSFDVTQQYTVSLNTFTAGNGFTGVQYGIVPVQLFGSVLINGTIYNYASVVANSAGVLFDSASTTSFVQFQFNATPVPEPSTYALAGVVALGGIVALRRRRNSSSAIAPAALVA